MLLSADVGETFEGRSVGFDSDVIPLVDVANIACGGHGGTQSSITTAIRLAKVNGVQIAAHPSYVDPENFGRRSLALDPATLQIQLRNQYRYLRDLVGEAPQLVKAHGALYNDMFSNTELARVYLEAFSEESGEITFIGAPNSALEEICRIEKVPFIREGFADRRYLDDASLAPRSLDGSLIANPNEIVEQIQTIADESSVTSMSGKRIRVRVNVICFHGDHPPSVEALKAFASVGRNRK